jgi:endonuclease/exonuclease/phosphatase family metal-dependent hydrolase
MKLKLATYNIHACIGTDGLFDPIRIIDVIRELDADIIALQEVEHHLVNDLNLLDFLADSTGMYCIAGPTMYRDTRHYGNAVLSKHQFTSSKLIDLSVNPYEPRGAIQLSIKINKKELLVMATHLGLKPMERRFQAEQLLNFIQQYHTHSTVLMGDLNEWFLWGKTLRNLKAYFGTTPARKSFPSLFPLFALDRIWVHPRNDLINLFVHKSALAKKASDHLPVLAEIHF